MSMKVRLAILGIAGLLAFGFVAQRAVAGNQCTPHTCASVIDQCIAEDGCEAMSGHDRAACRNDCAKGVRAACSENPAVCNGGSPSGAFLD